MNCKFKYSISLAIACFLLNSILPITIWSQDIGEKIDRKEFDPATLMWYEKPAKIWEDALPVGNGRLGGMVLGGVEEEKIFLNEDTYYSGGPYSTVVEGGHKILPEIQKLLFEGEPIKAHKLFSRNLLGYPIEQMKYQSLGALHLFYKKGQEYSNSNVGWIYQLEL